MADSNSDKLSRRQEQAIVALLENATLTEAAAAARVGSRTLRRWMETPLFRTAYRRARREILDHAIGRAQRLTSDAVELLHTALTNNVSATRVRAALGLIDRAMVGADRTDMEERLAAIEEALRQITGQPGS
jgi:hypothetical protein